MTQIVVVGSFNADLVTYVERLPQPGETLAGREFTNGPGGKGSNQAVAAARLGASVDFVGRVGNDTFADMAFRLWQSVGVNTGYVIRDAHKPTGVATIFVADSGENVIVIAGNANDAVSRDDIDAAESIIAQADVLLTQLEVPLDVAHYALEVARKHNVTTILNPAPAQPLPAEMLELIDVITPNEGELAILNASVQLPVSDSQTLVVTQGSKGVRWQKGDQSGEISAFEVEMVDSVGAGDAFNAGLAVALADGDSLAEALTFASAVAAIAVTRYGASTAMPKRGEVEAFLALREED